MLLYDFIKKSEQMRVLFPLPKKDVCVYIYFDTRFNLH